MDVELNECQIYGGSTSSQIVATRMRVDLGVQISPGEGASEEDHEENAGGAVDESHSVVVVL